MREKDRGGRTRWRRGGEGRGGEAKSNAATPDGRPLSRCGGEWDGRRGRGQVGMGITVRVARGRGAARGYIIAWGAVWAGAGRLGRGRSRPLAGAAPQQADRWEWPGRHRAEVFWLGRAVPPGRPNWRPKDGLVHGPCLARAR